MTKFRITSQPLRHWEFDTYREASETALAWGLARHSVERIPEDEQADQDSPTGPATGPARDRHSHSER